MDELDPKTPSTIGEVGIYLKYMSRDLKDVKDTMTTLKDNFVPRAEHEADIRELDTKIETVKTELNTRIDNIDTQLNDRIDPLWKLVYGIISVVGVTILGAFLKLVLKV